MSTQPPTIPDAWGDLAKSAERIKAARQKHDLAPDPHGRLSETDEATAVASSQVPGAGTPTPAPGTTTPSISKQGATMNPKTHGLRFAAGNHTYRLDGQPVPGVTTILGCLDKPAIPKWAATQVAQYVADNPDAVEQLRSLGTTGLVNALKEIPWKRRDDAANRGTTLHDYAEQLLAGADVDVEEELVPVVESALQFMDDWHIEPLLTEVAVGSREHRYAGTFDLIAKYRRPDTGHEGIGLFDWKSGKALYPEYAWQLAAYGFAEFHGLNGNEQPVPECDGSFGVQIRADGYDVAPFAYGPAIFDEFLAIRRTFDIVKQGRGNWKIPGSGHVGVMIQAGQVAA